MSQSKFWKRNAQRAMHAAAPTDLNPAPAVMPLQEWAAAGVGAVVERARKAAVAEYLRRLGAIGRPPTQL